MNIGSLYQVKNRFWLLFPTRKTTAIHLHYTSAVQAKQVTRYYIKECNLNVTWFSPDSFVVCLEEDGDYKKVLTSESLIGWIWVGEENNECFEEVK